MNRRVLCASAVILVLTACQPTSTLVAYDPYDYDFRYAIYEDYWDGSDDIDRPDRPRPPAGSRPRPEQPIYLPPSTPQASYRASSVPRGSTGGRVGGAGGLRGSRR
jgi:hypothetical protein